MSKRRVVYFTHSIRSDWNNGNAHFVRGLLRGLVSLGHTATSLESVSSWSYTNLLAEGGEGERSAEQFSRTYPEIDAQTYVSIKDSHIDKLLSGADVVLIHEWSEPELVDRVLELRELYKFRVVFHDTHHRVSSDPGKLAALRVKEFDGILAFGESLRKVYLQNFGARKVWVLHEAADTSVFYPRRAPVLQQDLIWIGNWGDEERSEELHRFLLAPVKNVGLNRATVHGVRYSAASIGALNESGVLYKGYLANLDAPLAYAASRMAVHVPRRQYAQQLPGVPTIRVFEALACGVPLISAPWQDVESLFSKGDFLWAKDTEEMAAQLRHLSRDNKACQQLAAQGVRAVEARHTTRHRAEQLSEIFEEVLA